MLTCLGCGDDRVVKNGHTRRGKQNHKCRGCGCQFVKDPTWRRVGGLYGGDPRRPTPSGGQSPHPIERFNNTLRQRISRLVRKTLSFSKKQTHHVAAIWNFIHYYNASLPV